MIWHIQPDLIYVQIYDVHIYTCMLYALHYATCQKGCLERSTKQLKNTVAYLFVETTIPWDPLTLLGKETMTETRVET